MALLQSQQENQVKNSVPSSYEILSHSIIASGKNINNNEYHNFPSLSYLNQALYYAYNGKMEIHINNLQKKKENKINSNTVLSYIISNKAVKALLALFYSNEKIILIKVNELLNILITTEQYFDDLCPSSIGLDFANTILRLIYKNNPLSLIFQVLIHKAHIYINYLKKIDSQNTEMYNELLDSYPIPKSISFLDFKNNLVSLNFYDLINDSDDITNNMKGIDILINCINDLPKYIEQFEVLNKVAESLITPITSSLFLFNVELYLKLGNFLDHFLFLNKYELDSSLPENGDVIPGHNYVIIFQDIITYDLSLFGFLHKKRYSIEYLFDILQSFPHEIINSCIIYIKAMIKLDTDFNIQFLIFKILKKLYFIYPLYRDLLKEYIPLCLNNLCLFKELKEWDKGLESREFAYYILSNDQELGSLIKSVSSQPKEDIELGKLLFRDLDIKTGYMTRMVIDSGMKNSIEVNVNTEESIVFVEFYIEEKKSLNVNVYKIDNKNAHNKKIICKLNKIKSLDANKKEIKTIRIVLYTKDIATYEVEFDNTFSWITMKTIHYKVVILKPI